MGYALNDEDEIEEEHRLFYVGITRAKNQLFLSLHHEGSRGGITQFNKISRFVDAPSVLSMLEQKGIPEFESNQIASYSEPEAVISVYDKKELYKKVIDFFK